MPLIPVEPRQPISSERPTWKTMMPRPITITYHGDLYNLEARWFMETPDGIYDPLNVGKLNRNGHILNFVIHRDDVQYIPNPQGQGQIVDPEFIASLVGDGTKERPGYINGDFLSTYSPYKLAMDKPLISITTEGFLLIRGTIKVQEFIPKVADQTARPPGTSQDTFADQNAAGLAAFRNNIRAAIEETAQGQLGVALRRFLTELYRQNQEIFETLEDLDNTIGRQVEQGERLEEVLRRVSDTIEGQGSQEDITDPEARRIALTVRMQTMNAFSAQLRDLRDLTPDPSGDRDMFNERLTRVSEISMQIFEELANIT